MQKITRLLATIFLILETADGIFTYYGVNHGIEELNPLMAPIAGEHYFPILKMLAGFAVIFLIYKAIEKGRTIKPYLAVFILLNLVQIAVLVQWCLVLI